MATPSDKNKLAVLIASKVPGPSKGKGKDKADGPGEPPATDHEYEHGLIAASADVISAIEESNARALSWALRDFVKMCAAGRGKKE